MKNFGKFTFSSLKRIEKPRTAGLLLSLVLALLGSMYMRYTWVTTMNETSKQAINTARIAEAGFQKGELNNLDVSLKDIEKQQYKEIKSALMKLKSIEKEAAFTYIYTQKKGEIYFIADSAPADSKDYSPPGQEYTEADKAYSKPFKDGIELITAPATDRWGTWVSVLIPMKDLETGKIIAVFATDYPAQKWTNEAVFHTVQAGVIVFVLFLLLHGVNVILNKNILLKKKQHKLELANTESIKANLIIKKSEEKFSKAFNSGAVLMAISGVEDGCFIDVNEAFLKTLGFDREEVIGKKSTDLDIFVDNKQGEAIKNQFKVNKTICDFEVVIKGGNGLVHTCILTAESITMGETLCWIITMTDITERKLAEEALMESKSRLIAAQLMAHVGNWELNLDTKTFWGSEEASNIYGIEYISQFMPLDIVQKCVFPEYLELLDSTLIGLITKKEKYDVEYKIKNVKTGEERFVHSKATLLVDDTGNAAKVVGTIQDITEHKKKEIDILYLSYHDQLTGLYNRRFYEEELKKLDTERNLPLTIVMGDVNGLKLINDSFGHTMGDELLKKVAKVLTEGCRTDDIIARLAGDEFVIVLPKTDAFETEQIIKRITDLSLSEKVGSIDISISFGYETKNNQEEKIQDIFKAAEDHMYKKKIFESQSMRGKIIKAIINTLHEKNKREEEHSHRVSALCKNMGEILGLNEYENEELRSVGLLHDIGKIAIDENVLNKPGKLTEDEWKEIKCHPEIGYRILNTVNDLSDMAKYVLYHHERWDGKGYPKGLKGDEIPFVSRIIAIADAYDAMTSERSYRSALPGEVAIKELQKNAGTQFDPELVSVFIEKVLGQISGL